MRSPLEDDPGAVARELQVWSKMVLNSLIRPYIGDI